MNEIISKSKPAYLNNRPSFTYSEYNKSGVYFIISNNIIVYVGLSFSCSYKALYRHFQRWHDKKNMYCRATYGRLNTNVFIEPCDKSTVAELEAYYIRLLTPPDNREYYLHKGKKKISEILIIII